MEFLILLYLTSVSAVTGLNEVNDKNMTKPTLNSTDVKKDMYVIHAMVYQVGIITNKTSNETDNNIGNQEAVTFFHSNGSKINFSKIPQAILTNVTAQSAVGILSSSTKEQPLELSNITNLESLLKHKEESSKRRGLNTEHVEYINANKLNKRSNEAQGNDVFKILKGSVIVPEEAGVHSIALPPLLALNNNFSNIPVPIPNTSIVHYSKINTLVHSPGQLL